MALAPGSFAGPYRIVDQLGRGGMASVYKAYEAKLDRYVALKVLPREFLHDPSFAERFRREAQVVAKLEHPHIIPIYAYDIDEADGIPWMAMRLLSGRSLAELIKRERLARARAVAILRGVADALDYAHGKKIVHRDVKPQNVLLDEAGRVYLADFGIAKMLESSGGLTASGMITGTPQYMAPEQATGLKVGPPADVYALGIMAYEMLTGRVPFSADTPVAVLMKHVQEALPLPPPDVVPEPLLRALLRATAKKPEDRWPSAGSFVDALEAGQPAPSAVASAPTIAIVRDLPPAPPTIVSPKTAPAAPGTAPPLPPRPPVMRPPAGSREPALPQPRARSSAPLLWLGALGVVALAAVAAGWLLLGRGSSAPPEASVTPTVAAGSRPEATPAPGSRASAPPESTAASPVARNRPAPADTRAPAVVPTPTTAPTTPRPTIAPTPVPTATPAPVVAATPAPVAAPPTVDPEIERLAAALSDRDTATRRRAAQDLSSRGPLAAPAAAALEAALGDRSADVRLRAAEALGRIGLAAQGSATALAAALRDADPLVAAEAAKALGLIGEAAAPAAPALGAALGHREVSVRREAARALARLGRRAEPALGELVAALSDKDKTVCAQSARALGRIGAAASPAVPRLTALSRDPDVLVSREAQLALESIGQKAR